MAKQSTSPEAGIALGGKRPAKSKRSIIHVVCDGQLKKWLVRYVRMFDEAGNPITETLRPDPYPTKREALKSAVKWAKDFSPSSLRIHGRDGKFQEERTYPRSSDPRSTKG